MLSNRASSTCKVIARLWASASRLHDHAPPSYHSGRYQILFLYLSHGLRETACPGVAALHACCRLYNTLSLRFLTMCTLVPDVHSTLSSAS
jgi:hypothetical protein